MIGYKNEALKRVGVSKHRLMSGHSETCVVCDKTLVPGDTPHTCAEHSDWELVVVDTDSQGKTEQYLLGHENED